MIYWLVYGLLFTVFVTEVVVYPGIIKNYFLINPTWLLVFWGILSFIMMVKKKSGEEIKGDFLVKINKYGVIVFSGLMMIGLQLLESRNHPNYIFSRFGIFHYNLIFIFWLAFLTDFFSIDLDNFLSKWKSKIFSLSVGLILTSVILYFWPNDFFAKLAEEDGVLENLQFVFYLLSGITALVISRKLDKKNNLLKIGYILAGLGLIFVAGEEISWGQRLFNFSLPSIQGSNYKDEINLHNHNSITGILNSVFVIVGLYGSLAYLFLKKFGRWINNISPSTEYFLYFFTLVVAYTRVINIDKLYQDEVSEFMLALGIFLFLWRNWMWFRGNKKLWK